MREPENCSFFYCGFKSPHTFDEIQFEVLGLEHLIKRAEERMSMLKQSSFLANLAITNESEDLNDYFFKEEDELDDQGNIVKEKKQPPNEADGDSVKN